jgi:DNA-binding FrmR family transcriptional regulator
VLTQVAAVTKALQAVSLSLLEDHMNHCVVDAARAGEQEGREKVTEAVDAITRLVRS